MIRTPCLCIDSEELPLRPAGEWEDTDKGIPTYPTGETVITPVASGSGKGDTNVAT